MLKQREVLYQIGRKFCCAEGDGEWRTKQICMTERSAELAPGLVRTERTYRNISDRSFTMIPVVQKRFSGEIHKFTVPCVSYNGNRWGTGMEPKGLEYNGKPWIFPADRTGVPGCTIAETQEGVCTALFAAGDSLSANCSCSLLEYGARGYAHRLYFSHIESPQCYAEKFRYTAEVRENITLPAGGEVTYIYYLYEKKDCRTPYGYKELYDWLTLHYLPEHEPAMDRDSIYRYSMQFVRSLIERLPDGNYLSNMGYLPDGEHKYGSADCVFRFRPFGRYEAGWCGQNLSIARLLLKSYYAAGEREDAARAKGILNAWLSAQYPSGLFPSLYEARGEDALLDTCNLGWTVRRLVDCAQLLEEHGEGDARLIAAARAACNCVLRAGDGTRGFPQTMAPDGRVVNPDGMAGGMLAFGFIRLFEATGEQRYFSAAARAYRFYYDSYLAEGVAAGGAQDTYCVDKESAGPLLSVALALYRLTGEERYVREAENIGAYLRTWTFYYDVEYAQGTDAAAVGFCTSGGTAVSVQHNHLDNWALYYVPEFFELSRITGDVCWEELARAHWDYATQCISDGTFTLHGMKRPVGAQNEGFYQCNWCDPKGSLNDWLVAWVKTFQLDALEFLRDRA